MRTISTPYSECYSLVGLNESEVEQCASTQTGIDLTLKAESVTTPFIKVSNHVPTLVMDGKYDENEFAFAYNQFKAFAMKVAKENWKTQIKLNEFRALRTFNVQSFVMTSQVVCWI